MLKCRLFIPTSLANCMPLRSLSTASVTDSSTPADAPAEATPEPSAPAAVTPQLTIAERLRRYPVLQHHLTPVCYSCGARHFTMVCPTRQAPTDWQEWIGEASQLRNKLNTFLVPLEQELQRGAAQPQQNQPLQTQPQAEQQQS